MEQNMNQTMHKDIIYFYDDDNFICDGYKGPGWYFWDETETNLIGPFKTDSRALTALKVYTSTI